MLGYAASMRHARLATFGFAFAIIASLVACGGGGGGSSNTPAVTAPGNPGGATPAPSPTGSGTAPPSSPSPGASPLATVAPQSMIGVGDGETNGNPQPLLISTASNTNGYPGSGNLEPGQTGATSQGGGQGCPSPNTSSTCGPVDGINCAPTMSNYYHVHFFVGIFYTPPGSTSPEEIAVPAGVGMVNPYPPDQSVSTSTGEPVEPGTPDSIPNLTYTAECYYDFHVHDDSGMIHIETSDNGDCGAWSNGNPNGNTPVNEVQPCNYPAADTQNGQAWSLQTFFDIWGISISSTNFGPLQGAVTIYSTPAGYNSYSACPDGNEVEVPCETPSSMYSEISLQQALQKPLYSHTVFWILVNTSANPANLPPINWVEGDP